MNAFDKAKDLLKKALQREAEEAPQHPAGRGVDAPPPALPTARPRQAPAGGEAPTEARDLLGAPEPDPEFLDLVAEVGAHPATPEDAPFDPRGMELAELREMLSRLQPLGDELARTERARLALAARLDASERSVARLAAELGARLRADESDRARPAGSSVRSDSASSGVPGEDAALAEAGAEVPPATVETASDRERRLEARLAEREGVLERERARLRKAREERDERKRLATERWHEIQALRAELRERRD